MTATDARCPIPICPACGRPCERRPKEARTDFATRKYCSITCANHGRVTVDAHLRRFWTKVRKTESCWLWIGTTDGKGYGVISRPGQHRMEAAHRVSYELARGAVPAGAELDHVCRNTRCVNPAHLEPVTHRENVLRGRSPTAVNARATSCAHGHPFDATNTYVWTGRGGRVERVCRACGRERKRAAWRSARARSLGSAAPRQHRRTG